MEKDKLSMVRSAVVKAVPSIREHFNRCMACGYGFAYCRCTPKRTEYYEDRTIRLADCVLAMQLRPDNDFYTYSRILLLWNLRTDDLSKQSPACIDFLYSLLADGK